MKFQSALITKRVSKPSDRVTENIATYGAESLSNAQLIAFMLESKVKARSENLLTSAGSIGHLLQAGPAELRDMGLSENEASRLMAIPELLRRMTRPESGAVRPVILSAFQATSYLRPRCAGWTEERFGMLALNAKGELLADRIVSHGNGTGTLITPREFYREALRYGATTTLAWHNHPSGDPTPSKEDQALTKLLVAAGEGLGIPLSDHIIIGPDRCYSFRETELWESMTRSTVTSHARTRK